jgi:hypothetical protein
MRIFMMLGMLAAATLIDVKPGLAIPEGRWCARMSIGSGAFSSRCHFMSFEACRHEIFATPGAWCDDNPYYPDYWSKQKARRQRKSQP